MSLKRAFVYVDEKDRPARLDVEKRVTKVLARYPNSLLVEADDAQIKALKTGGREVELKTPAVIRLRTLEFDPAQQLPQPPAMLSRAAPKAVRPEKQGRDFWIVQFVGPVQEEWRDKVRALGGKVHGHVPDDAFIVEMTLATKQKLEKLAFVNWIGPYEPAYKLSPLLAGQREKFAVTALKGLTLRPERFKPTPLGNIRVTVHNPARARKVAEAVAKLGGKVINSGPGVLRVMLDISKVHELAKLADVKWIEPAVRNRLFNDVAAGILNVQQVRTDHGLDGDGQIVGVADTGLDNGKNDATLHEDFKGRVVQLNSWAIPSGYSQYLDNTSLDDGAADKDSGHGTHVAGSVLGNGTKSSGAIQGMAPAAKLVFQAVEQYCNWKTQVEQQGYTDGYYLLGIPDDLSQLFQQAYDAGARVHSNSWGGTNDDQGNEVYSQYTAQSQMIDDFIWKHKDMIILFAASNDGKDADSNGVIDSDSLSVQATAKNCITVGASENVRATGGYQMSYGQGWPSDFPANPIKNDKMSNNAEGMVAFSSRGPTDDGRVKPDVAAPGTNILSVRSSQVPANQYGWGPLPTSDPRRPYYMYMGGTSMSTPIASGTVALIRQYVMKVCLHTPSAALMKAFLIHGAHAMTGQYSPSEAGTPPNSNQGWGRIDLEGSLFADYPVKTEFRDDAADALGSGDYKDYAFNVVNGTAPLRATLVWSDYPAEPSSPGLVNQLRLSLTGPGALQQQAALQNNNVQQIVIANPQPGTYAVRVTGVNVASVGISGEKQPFALVVGGGLDFADLYIRDNLQDTGVPPSVGCLYLSPDIWVNLQNNPQLPPVENPEYGQTNYVFVRVHNRGPKAVTGAQVKLHWAKAGVNLHQAYWQTSGIKVNGVVGNTAQLDVAGRTATGDSEAVAAFEWRPPNPADYSIDPEHFCLFATVSHPDDPLLQQDVDVVRWEDNLAWKNVIVKDVLPDVESDMKFVIGGGRKKALKADLMIDRSRLPEGVRVELALPATLLRGARLINARRIGAVTRGIARVRIGAAPKAVLQGVAIPKDEATQAAVLITVPKGAEVKEPLPVVVEQRVSGESVGVATALFRVIPKPSYVADRRRRLIHRPACSVLRETAQLDRIPYQDLKLALRRGCKPCGQCMKG